jgi:hypothetical protein
MPALAEFQSPDGGDDKFLLHDSEESKQMQPSFLSQVSPLALWVRPAQWALTHLVVVAVIVAVVVVVVVVAVVPWGQVAAGMCLV